MEFDNFERIWTIYTPFFVGLSPHIQMYNEEYCNQSQGEISVFVLTFQIYLINNLTQKKDEKSLY